MKDSNYSEASEQMLLLIPYNWKPYLEHKENVSGEVRTILEQFEEKVKELIVKFSLNLHLFSIKQHAKVNVEKNYSNTNVGIPLYRWKGMVPNVQLSTRFRLSCF